MESRLADRETRQPYGKVVDDTALAPFPNHEERLWGAEMLVGPIVQSASSIGICSNEIKFVSCTK